MIKKKFDAIEDRVKSADAQYQRMMDRVNQGIVDKDEMISAMTMINTAHYIALKENRRDLL